MKAVGFEKPLYTQPLDCRGSFQPYTGCRDAILAHPTMAEGLSALFLEVPPSAADRVRNKGIR